VAKNGKGKPKSKAEVKAAADRAEARSKSTKKADVLPKTMTGKTAAQPVEGESAVTRAVNKGYKLISQNDLRNLLRTCKGLKDDLDETTGILREKIGYAVEKKNLNKKAFAELRKLDKMEPEKLADYWDTLQAYMEMGGLFERIESVTRLPLGEPQAAEAEGKSGETKEPAPPSETVSRPRLTVVNDETQTENKIPA